jgi:hypothetical protein
MRERAAGPTAIRPHPARAERAPELALPDADRVRRDLDQLVVVDPGERVLEAHLAVRDQTHGLVVARRAHVRELLLAADVHFRSTSREYSPTTMPS